MFVPIETLDTLVRNLRTVFTQSRKEDFLDAAIRNPASLPVANTLVCFAALEQLEQLVALSGTSSVQLQTAGGHTFFLSDLRADLEVVKTNFLPLDFCFSYPTVEALLDYCAPLQVDSIVTQHQSTVIKA